VRTLKKFLHPDTKISAVIKANAYGHGQNEVAQILENEVDYFQVDDIEELRLLRKVSKKQTLVLGYVAKNDLEEAVALEGILAVYDIERLQLLETIARKNKKPVTVHVKIDAFLGRQGVLADQIDAFAQEIKKCKDIALGGVYCHFANIEDTTDFSHAQKQIDAFTEAVKIFRAKGFADFATHASATSGILVYEHEHSGNTLARPGIGLYGMWPSEDLRSRFEKENFTLKPTMRWVTHIAQVKTLPADHSIGYGLTYITSKPTMIAVIPQGYGDGYDRGLSNSGEVLIGGKRCKVLGRVAMNMFVADVSHIENVRQEDEVVLLGKQGDEEMTAEELAAHLRTINYEITTRIAQSLPRVIVR